MTTISVFLVQACACILGTAAFVGPRLRASEIVLPSSAPERDSVIAAKYRMTAAVTGSGALSIRWSDALGRLVEERTIPFELADEMEVEFPLDMRRAVAMGNHLQAHLSIHGKNQKGEADNREEDAALDFVAKPAESGWHDYQFIMWQPYPKDAYPILKTLGITGGQFSNRAGVGLPQNLIANDMRWYSENIGTDYYSEYHRYRNDRIQHWSFLRAKALLKQNPNSLEAFKRHPSFWDPVWRARIQDRLRDNARLNSPYRPFFYSLADESGIADLAAFWDFDFSDQSLVPMRQWLRDRYATLPALNQEWGTAFTTWDLVTPPTTHEAMQRKDDNFAAWADFKEWMDITFADALLMGRKAIESVDPHAFVNIGGGQRPGWGGYDYARITKALTSIEPYDIGSNVEIIRSLNPDMPMVSTGFAKGPWEQQRVWRELFHGHRGLIIWDENHEYVENGKPGPRGLEAAKYYNEIRDGAGALIINSRPQTDRIAIHYSQASMRTEWMLARRPEGDKWIERGAKTERTDDEFLRLRESWCELIEDQGMQYNFVSYGQLEQGELLRGGYRVLVLPRSSSLSPAEASAIRSFVEQGGVAIADGEPGVFNEHSRRLAEPLLRDLFGGAHDGPVTARNIGKGKAIFLKAATLDYLQDRLVRKEGAAHTLVGDLLRSSGISPEFAVTDTAGKTVVGLETHVFRNGGAYVVTVMSNPLQRVDELGPPDFRSNQRFETPVAAKVTLPGNMYLYDSRTGKALGRKQSHEFTLGPYEPLILTASFTPLPKLEVRAPDAAKRGELVEIGIGSGGTPAGRHVYHVEVFDPQGTSVPCYKENLVARGAAALKLLPLAMSDAAGEWKIRVRDAFTGETREVPLKVN